MSEERFVDTSRPNAGRIYDYLLGGHHNFEVDRQAAEQFINMLPFLPKAMRLQRWCLQDLATELTEKRGFDIIIDFASGLPTNDHMHLVVPKGTTVIYSDRDPVVVEFAREILKDTPRVHFFQANAGRPEELLNRREVLEILGPRRDVAVVYWGVSIFLSDDELAHAARVLYDWTDKKSCWAFQAQGIADVANNPAALQISKAYERIGSPMTFRSLEKFQQLLSPWRTDKGGFVSLLDWHGMDKSTLSDDDRQAWGATGGNFGAYLIK